MSTPNFIFFRFLAGGCAGQPSIAVQVPDKWKTAPS